MIPNFIAAAIPFFFLLLGLEILVSWKKKLGFYRFEDTLANLGCGTLDQAFSLLIKGFFLLAYDLIYQRVSLPSLGLIPRLPESISGWVFAFLLVDFAYYLFHRMSHRISFLWAAHVVHHQSEEYNLSVALRQSVVQGIFSGTFFLGIAVIGVPIKMIIVSYAVNLIYQFWIHTRFVKHMGFLELFLNTPSHHRVHHGRDPEYLDRNYAGVFIIWDRWLGTFREEEREPLYGVVEPLNSYNPVWANLKNWVELFRAARLTPGLSAKIRLFLEPPKASSFETPASSEVRGERVGRPVFPPLLAFSALMALSLWVLNQGELKTMNLGGLTVAVALLFLFFHFLGLYLDRNSKA